MLLLKVTEVSSMSAPQAEFPIFTLTNGRQYSFLYEYDMGSTLFLVTRPSAQEAWPAQRYVTMTLSDSNPGYIAQRGGVATYLQACLMLINKAIRDQNPDLFPVGTPTPTPTPTMPAWLKSNHPDTIAFVKAIMSLKLSGNQLTL